jgi:hypothetical protein
MEVDTAKPASSNRNTKGKVQQDCVPHVQGQEIFQEEALGGSLKLREEETR